MDINDHFLQAHGFQKCNLCGKYSTCECSRTVTPLVVTVRTDTNGVKTKNKGVLTNTPNSGKKPYGLASGNTTKDRGTVVHHHVISHLSPSGLSKRLFTWKTKGGKKK